MAKSKASKSSPVQGLLAELFLGLFARLPLRWARAVGAGMGWILWLFPTRPRRITRVNLSRCLPNLPRAERRLLARTSLIESGRTMAEAGALWSWPVERLAGLIEEVEGEDLLDKAMARGKGVILLLPHLGNWEFLNPFLAGRYPFMALYRPPRVAEFDRRLRETREKIGAEMVPATTSGVRKLFRALGDGRLTVILPDQEPVRASGVFAPFFGVPALTMTLVTRALLRFDSIALYVWAERLPGGGFRLRFRAGDDGLKDADERSAASHLNAGVERCVLTCPAQYQWSYKRFKSRPAGGWPFYENRPPDDLPGGF